MNTNDSRLNVVDAIRGFAIISIMLLHNIEHFDYYDFPVAANTFIAALDKGIWDTLFFLFGGKSYAIFALLFGLTFFIQSDNQEKRGKDFRGRFAWRLLLLLGFGIINSAFYQGDILSIYAIIGFTLIPVAKLSNKAVFWIAAVLMFQPYEWFNFFKGLSNPGLHLGDPVSWSFFGKMGEYVTGDSVLNLWIGNLTNGKKGVFLWVWENGRVFQTSALFMFGMLAGRKKLFKPTEESQKFWKWALIISSIAFIPLFIFKTNIPKWIESVAINRPLGTIITSWSNLAFMIILVSGFVLLFQKKILNKILNIFSPIGRMSLSNYIMQSMLGATIYYGYGLGIYNKVGTTYSFMIGIGLALFQGWFCTWWFRHHNKGPLETLWHKATWVGVSSK